MLTDILIRALVGLLPVLVFLLVLVYMDSYKLVKLRTVLWVILTGALLPIAGYWINGYVIDFELGFSNLLPLCCTRY